MEVKQMERSQWSLFEALNAESDWGHVFNAQAWLRSIEDLFGGGGELEIFGVFDGGELVAGLPLQRGESGGEAAYGGKKLCFPATPYSGLTIGQGLLDRHPRDQAVHAAGEAVADFFCQFPTAFLLHPPEYVDLRPFLARGWKANVKFDYRIDLAALDSVDELLSPAMKRMVEAESSRGAVLRPSQDADLFTKLWRTTYGSEGAFGFDVERGKQHFRNLLQSETAQFHVASDESGEATCGWFVLTHGRKMYGYGTLNLRGSDALYTWMRHAVLEHFRREGFDEFNWCGANVFKRMAFKMDFNPRLIPFFGCDWTRQEGAK